MRSLPYALFLCLTATSWADPAAPMDAKTSCALAERAVDGALRCAPDSKPTLEQQRALIKNAQLPNRAYRPDALDPVEECAWIALESARVSRSKTCTAALTDAEHARLHALLDFYGKHRTTPKPSGDPGIAHTLAGMTSARDRVCACKDASCAHAAVKDYEKRGEQLPADSTAATDASSVLTEMGRCSRRLDFTAERP